MHRSLDRSNFLLPDNTDCLVDQYLRTILRKYLDNISTRVHLTES